MNIAFFLTLKKDVAFLYDDFTLRQGLEKMKFHGYTAIPVLDREGKYVGTISEGDFLWYLFDSRKDYIHKDIKEIEKIKVKDILKPQSYERVKITAKIDEMLSLSLGQNFVPVVDDMNSFVGIVLRKDIIKHFTNKRSENVQHKYNI